jgi:hypothetical protein
MPVIRRVVSISCLGLVLAASMFSAAEQKTFTSARFGYELRLPKSWNISVADSGVPVFFNYPRAEALPQGLIPDHGAEIYLIPFAALRGTTRAKDLKEWIQINTRREHSRIHVTQVPGALEEESAPHNVFRVTSDFERDPQDGIPQREIDYYFQLNGEGFRLRLVYWKGDPRSTYFESVQQAIFRSIRAVTTHTSAN